MLLQSTHSGHPFSSNKDHTPGPVHVLSTVIAYGPKRQFKWYHFCLKVFQLFIFPSYVIKKSLQKYTIKENKNEIQQNDNNNINNEDGSTGLTRLFVNYQ